MDNSIQIHEIQNIDLGAFFPKESTFRNILLEAPIKNVNVSCGCVTTHHKINSKVLTIKYNAPKEFPFQLENELYYQKSQIVTVKHENSETKIRLSIKVLNPKKW